MLGRLEPNDSPARLAEDEPWWNGELVDERRQRMLQRRHQFDSARLVLLPRANGTPERFGEHQRDAGR
jgi:hypothetical protein